MENKKTIREIIVESSVIISSILIFFGFLKQYWYYNHFNIKIQNYLSIDEVLIMFLGELPFLIKLILGMILYYVFLLTMLKVYFKIKDRKIKNTNSEDQFIEKVNILFQDNSSSLLIWFFISLVLSIICGVIFYYNHSDLAIIYLTLILSQTIYLFVDIVGGDNQFINIIVIICALSTMLYCKNIIDVNFIRNELESVDCKIKGDKEPVLLKKYLMIGKTKEFLFLYDKSTNITRIIKNENVIELEIK